MNFKRQAMAGSLESSDVLISVAPAESNLEILVESLVERQFGKRINALVADAVSLAGLEKGKIHVRDRGALECTLRARLETAFARGGISITL